MPQSEIAPLPIGTKLYEYRIDKVLGQGGFGITYLGKNIKLDANVVIKENIPGSGAFRRRGSNEFMQAAGAPRTGPGSAEWARANFIREAHALAKMQHPGVISVLESFESKTTQTQYYIMPYVGGGSLKDGMNKGLEPTYDWLHYILCSLLNTLSYVHKCGMLHRDIKPDNILVHRKGQPVLIDFGSARAVEISNKTRIVTEDYSPIEQVRGEGEGPWTDIYALGATFYHIITGKGVPRPVERLDNPDSYIPLAGQDKLLKKYGYPILASIDHALLFEPSARYSSADEWLKAMSDVEGFQSEHPIPLPIIVPLPQGPSLHLAQPTIQIDEEEEEKKPVLLWLIPLLLVLLMLALLLQFCQPQSKPAATISPAHVAVIPEAPQPEPEQERRLIVRPGAKLYAYDTQEDAINTEKVKRNFDRFSVYYMVDKADSNEDYYLVTSKYNTSFSKTDAEGAISKEQAHIWPNNLSMKYRISTVRRNSLFFDSADHTKSYVKMSQNGRNNVWDQVAKIFDLYKEENGPQIVNEKMKSITRDYGVTALEPIRKGGQYLMPVLDFLRDKDGDPAEVFYNSSGNVSTNIIEVAAMTAQPIRMEDTVKKEKQEAEELKVEYKPPTEVIFVIDTSKSMGPFIGGVRYIINNVVQDIKNRGLDENLVKYGLVAYRDWKFNSGVKIDGIQGDIVNNIDESFFKEGKDGIGYLTAFFDSQKRFRTFNAKEFVNFTKSECSPKCSHNIKLFNAEEFLACMNATDYSGRYLLREAEGDSIDCHEDVAAGLDLARKMFEHIGKENGEILSELNREMTYLKEEAEKNLTLAKLELDKHDKKEVDEIKNRITGPTNAKVREIAELEDTRRIIILIGDAPGRNNDKGESCVDKDGREVGALALGSPYWKERPAGSVTKLSIDDEDKGVKASLAGLGISVKSFYIEPDKYKSLKDKPWNEYVKKGAKQFEDLSNVNSFRMKAPPNNNREVFEREIKHGEAGYILIQDFIEALTATLRAAYETKTHYAYYSLESKSEIYLDPGVAAYASIGEGEKSAIDNIFHHAELYRLSQQDPNGKEKPLDMTGWTMDTSETGTYSTDDEDRRILMQQCVVLSRTQFENMVQKLDALHKEIGSAEGTEMTARLTELLTTMISVLKDPERTFGTDEDILKSAIRNIPYRSNLIQRLKNVGISGILSSDGQGGLHATWTDLKNKFEELKTFSSLENVWLHDRTDPDNREKDFIILPLKLLP